MRSTFTLWEILTSANKMRTNKNEVHKHIHLFCIAVHLRIREVDQLIPKSLYPSTSGNTYWQIEAESSILNGKSYSNCKNCFISQNSFHLVFYDSREISKVVLMFSSSPSVTQRMTLISETSIFPGKCLYCQQRF